MPGSSLPSRYSRLAPPPVEMWPNAASSKPSVRTAAAESPPPTTESPSTSVSAWATARVPSANAGVSKTPIGPFQNTVRAPASGLRERRARTPGRCRGRARRTGSRRRGRPAAAGRGRRDGNSVSTTMSVGSRISTPVSSARCEVLAAGVELVLLEQALADLVALRLEEGEDHAAADEQACRPCRAGCRSRRACRRPWSRRARRRRAARGPR